MSKSLLDRIVDILECFDRVNPSLGITEISSMTDLPKGTVHRIVKRLSERGILEKDLRTDRYLLGARLIALAGISNPRAEVVQFANDYMVQLRDRFEETVLLSLHSGKGEHFTAHQVESHSMIRNIAEIGQHRPLYLGCGGKTILAFRPSTEVEAVLSSTTDIRTSTGERISLNQVRNDLSEIARVGYAQTTEEITKGASGIGVPLFDLSSACFGSLYIVGPMYRFGVAEKYACLPELIMAGQAISRRCGFEDAYPAMGAEEGGAGANEHRREESTSTRSS